MVRYVHSLWMARSKSSDTSMSKALLPGSTAATFFSVNIVAARTKADEKHIFAKVLGWLVSRLSV